jgi:hypothetical protein
MKLELLNAKRVKTGDPALLSVEIPLSLRFEYRELLRKGQPVDRYNLVIQNPTRKRSTGPWSQNHHLNGHAMQIAQETGQNFDDVKLYAKRQAIARGLPLKLKPNGEIVYSIVDGQPVPISETEMDTLQCGWVIDEIHILAAELGIILREE